MPQKTNTLSPHILARMARYLGGETLEEATAVFLSRCDFYDHASFETRTPAELGHYLKQGLDVGRSLWDRRAFIIHLDLDYFNFDDPAAAYRDRQRTFQLQQPVATTVLRQLAAFGIKPLHLITGRGQHFVWQLNQESDIFHTLAELGELPPRQGFLENSPRAPGGETISRVLVKAFVGLGQVMEYLAQLIRAAAVPLCELPVMITSVVGPRGRHGREIIALDISAFGDPIQTRVIRIPFSLYGKTRVKQEIPSPGRESQIPEIFTIPLGNLEIREAVANMQDSNWVSDYAEQAETSIPYAATGMIKLLTAYQGSSLRSFHAWFYATDPELAPQWPAACEQELGAVLDPCTARLLSGRDPQLLEATALQQVVRVLAALGWHPRHMAGLVRFRFEGKPHLWGDHWKLFDPGIRAEFYCRLFAGMLFTGADDLQDFTWQAAREKGVCDTPEEACTLARLQNILIQGRKKHAAERDRPFHRLFLSEEHF